MGKKVSPKTPQREVVATRALFHANEDGTSCSIGTPIFLNKETMKFEIDPPSYMVVGGSMQPTMTTPLTHEGFSNVLSIYEDLADRYSKWRLAQNRTPMLWVGMFTAPGSFAAEQFGVDSMVGLGVREVISVKDGSDEFIVDPKTFKVMGLMGAVKPILLPDTPEVRMKAAHLIASLKTASAILEGLRAAEDPAAYLLAISTDWQGGLTVEPAAAETPQPKPGSDADSSFEQAMSSSAASSNADEDDDVL